MSSEHLADLIRARPFKPFRIHLADGRTLNAWHPDFILRSPGGRTAILFTPKDRLEIIDMGLVTSLEVVNGLPAAGRKKRR